MEAVGDARVSLGEAPLWHGREGRIYWVDINGKTVRRVVGETSELVFEGVMVTALAETVDGELVMVSSDGLFVWREGEVTRLTSLDLPDGVRTNDGKCDPEGRLWFGTMDLEMSNPIGALLRYDGNSVEMVEDEIILSNGLGWSPDRGTLYHTDTARRHIYRYEYDPATGVATNRSILVDLGDSVGGPDGLAVDVEGNLWVAIYGGWRLQVFDPTGRTVHVEELEVQQPTSVAFGGEALASLYVTTASQDLTADELDRQPDAGRLLRFDPGIEGVPVGSFRPQR